MLLADKEHLERDLKRSLLLLAEKELVFFEQALISVGTQAALIAGFASGIIIETASDLLPDAHMAIQVGWIFATTTGMVLEISCVVFAMQLSILAPGLALRGPDGSMHPAVDGMMIEYRTAYYSFVLGLVFFHFSAALFSWLIYVHWAVSTMVTLCILGSLWLLYRYAKRVYLRFRLMPEEVITGRFTGDEVLSAGGTAAGLDQHEQRHLSSLISKEQMQLHVAAQQEQHGF
mmetsp:Transcript_36577/g.77085  ORF Transcript_36577/g.77085 Transcript_36577/m.77085 type:complete len:232 (-) Transcript_36577:693-1388(-)